MSSRVNIALVCNVKHICHVKQLFCRYFISCLMKTLISSLWFVGCLTILFGMSFELDADKRAEQTLNFRSISNSASKNGLKHSKILLLMLSEHRIMVCEIVRQKCAAFIAFVPLALFSYSIYLLVKRTSSIENICELIRKMESNIAFREMRFCVHSFFHLTLFLFSKHITQFECNYD